jgi:hypothetical protein
MDVRQREENAAMQAIRKIVDADRLASVIALPEEMLGGKLEVIILPAQETGATSRARSNRLDAAAIENLVGRFHQYANPERIAGEKGAWFQAAAGKAARANP